MISVCFASGVLQFSSVSAQVWKIKTQDVGAAVCARNFKAGGLLL